MSFWEHHESAGNRPWFNGASQTCDQQSQDPCRCLHAPIAEQQACRAEKQGCWLTSKASPKIKYLRKRVNGERSPLPSPCSSTVFELSRVSCKLQRVLEASKAVEKMKVFVLDDVEFCLSDYTDYTTVSPIDHPLHFFPGWPRLSKRTAKMFATSNRKWTLRIFKMNTRCAPRRWKKMLSAPDWVIMSLNFNVERTVWATIAANKMMREWNMKRNQTAVTGGGRG